MKRPWALGLLALGQASCVALVPTGLEASAPEAPGPSGSATGVVSAHPPSFQGGVELDSGPAGPAPRVTAPEPGPSPTSGVASWPPEAPEEGPVGVASPRPRPLGTPTPSVVGTAGWPSPGLGLVTADGGEELPPETYPYPSERPWSPESLLGMLNEMRTQVGLRPARLSEAHSRGALAHAKYLVLNHGHPALEGLKAHQEDPRLPGYTKEGAEAGGTGNIVQGGWAVDAMEGWRDTYYHRLPMLSPHLATVGFGHHTDGKERASVLSFQSGTDLAPEEIPDLVVYPGDGQQGLTWDFGPETPYPLPREAPPAGYPVTFQFSVEWSLVQAKLRRASGEALPCYVYHRGAMPVEGNPGNGLVMIPKAPLDDDQEHRVELTWKDGEGRTREHRSSFRTAAIPTIRSLGEAPRWVNQRVWVEGTVGAVGRTDFPGLPAIPKLYLERKAGEPQLSFFVREEWLRFWPPEAQWKGMKVRLMGELLRGSDGPGTLALVPWPSWRASPPTAPDPLR